jgi:HTH-type transcriptional regulator, sugar sensing transcriptional regulator
MFVRRLFFLGMNEELLSAVEDLGLSQKEARVYVANLMLGPSTVQKIADQADIKRVTTYVVLESLAGLGLVSQSNHGKKTYFTAEDPISLRRLLEKKEQQVADQKVAFESILPDLRGLESLPADTPNVKFYNSTEGINSLMKVFFALQAEAGEEVLYGISNLDQVDQFFPEIERNLLNPERLKAGIKSRFLYTSSKGPVLQRTDDKSLRESKYIPMDKYPLNGDFTILGDTIIMLSLVGKPLGITIKSEEIAKGLTTIFNLAWEAAEKNYPV